MIRDRRDVEHARRSQADGPLVRCEQLTVAYGSAPARVLALDRVDFALHAGETVALWGPSGSGKTTLLHVLGGLVEPNEGAVRWCGAPLSTVDADARTRGRPHDIAYVFQGSKLLPVFTAYENIAFAAFVSNAARDAECGVEGRAMEMLDARRARREGGAPSLGALRRRGTAGRNRPRAGAAARPASLR